MRGAMKNVVALLGLLLLSVACGAKKLWGVDVSKKEDVSKMGERADKTNFDRNTIFLVCVAIRAKCVRSTSFHFD